MAGYNCYADHGATELPDLSGVSTLADCKATCLRTPECEAVTMAKHGATVCYRRYAVDIAECSTDSPYNTYMLIRSPSPPGPPAPPPLRPMSPAQKVANRLNERFRHARPEAASGGKPLGAGVVMHQFDNFEARDKQWAPCDNSPQYPCNGGSFSGRISTFLIFRGMHARRDRVAIPLISMGGGVVVDPNIKLKCAYGDDGSTYKAPGGCYQQWCDAHNPFRGGHPCGFGGANQIDHAWHSYDLSAMLRLYNEHSQHYKRPQFYSGYNELVYDASSAGSRFEPEHMIGTRACRSSCHRHRRL